MKANRFHLALEAGKLEETLPFYTDILGCELGPNERDEQGILWQDVDFFGNELTFHRGDLRLNRQRHEVDMGKVCVPHFGVWLSTEEYETVKQSVKEKWQFFDEEYIRFENQPTEQRTFFVEDYAKWVLEIKTKKE